MKILYLIPGVMAGSKQGAGEMERRCRILQEHAAPGVEVSVWDTKNGPHSIESLYEEYCAIPETIAMAIEAEKQGFDAIVMGCYADPGIDAIREMVHIPVVGPFETSVLTSLTLGYHFSILTVTESMTNMLEEKVAALGVADRKLASVRAVDMNVLDLLDSKDTLRERIFACVETIIKEDNADCVALGCITMAFSGMDAEISEKFGIPVVNPILTALHQAQAMVWMGLSHSKRAFPLPPKMRGGCC